MSTAPQAISAPAPAPAPQATEGSGNYVDQLLGNNSASGLSDVDKEPAEQSDDVDGFEAFSSAIDEGTTEDTPETPTQEAKPQAAEGDTLAVALQELIQKFAQEEGLDPNDPKQLRILKDLAQKELSIQSLQGQKRPDSKAQEQELMFKLAEQYGLDPSDPAQARTLRRLAHKEMMIQKLQGQGPANAAGQPLTEFERSLIEQSKQSKEPGQEAKPPEAAKPTAAPPETPLRYGDIGDTWKSPEEAYQQWEEAFNKNDYARMDEIQRAQSVRWFDKDVLPKLGKLFDFRIQQMIGQFRDKELGSVLQPIKQTLEQRQVADDAEFALRQLESTEGFDSIRNLLKTEEGPDIEINGELFKNTPMNRIVADNPWIGNIRVDHADPSTARRLTMIERYRAAHSIQAKQKPSGLAPEVASDLVKAGATMASRTPNDRVRQSLNAGSGASSSAPKGSNSYVEGLVNLPGSRAFSSLFK